MYSKDGGGVTCAGRHYREHLVNHIRDVIVEHPHQGFVQLRIKRTHIDKGLQKALLYMQSSMPAQFVGEFGQIVVSKRSVDVRR